MKSYVPVITEVLHEYGFKLSDRFGHPLSNSHPWIVGVLEPQPIDQHSFWERYFNIPKEYQLANIHLHTKKYGSNKDSLWHIELFGYSRQEELNQLAKNLEHKLGFSVKPVLENRPIRTEPVDPCDLI